MAEPMLSIQNVTKHYESAATTTPSNGEPLRRAAVDDVSLDVEQGETVSLLGPSGCGKSTLLRMVAGLERPDGGRILLHGQNLAGLPVHKRGFGLMFQEFALFPDKSVAENVAFGLRMAGESRAAIRARVGEMLELVGLAGYGERSIFALSGGERQRVALARSLAPRPRLLMLDEPLGSLDRLLREGLLDELRRILKQLGITTLYVTHDQQEALAVADRVALMRAGKLVQVATPHVLHEQPANAWAAGFLGFDNLLDAEVFAATPQLAHTSFGSLPLDSPAPPGDWVLLIRPNALLAPDEAAQRGLPLLQGRVAEQSFRGHVVQVKIDADGQSGARVTLIFEVPPGQAPETGQSLEFGVDPAQCTLIPH